jgi:signal transduction histidine kinase
MSETKGFVKIQITDTGIGMPPNVVKRLFDIDYNYSTQGTWEKPGRDWD